MSKYRSNEQRRNAAIQPPAWTEYLSCNHCNKEFNLTDKQPYSLGCGHTFCKSCVSRMKTHPQCPFDSFVTDCAKEDLPKNLALLRLISGDGEEEELRFLREDSVRCCGNQNYFQACSNLIENIALHLQGDKSKELSRPMQRKLVLLLHCQLIEEEGRKKALRTVRALGERTATELILLHQNPTTLSASLWAAVRSRGCQFLGPAMQEEALKLIHLALEDGSELSRKVLVQLAVKNLQTQFTQASKTSIGHVVQLLYRASCFVVKKRDSDSSLMKLKEEFLTYDELRKEHDSQVVQIAREAGLRIAPDQWSALLYGDQAHKSYMQSIIDRLQSGMLFSQCIDDLRSALLRSGDPGNLTYLVPHFKLLSDINPESVIPSWMVLEKSLDKAEIVVNSLVDFMKNHNHWMWQCQDAVQQTSKYKTSMCRDIKNKGVCPRGVSCTFAHSEEELQFYRNRRKKGGVFNVDSEMPFDLSPPEEIDTTPGLVNAKTHASNNSESTTLCSSCQCATPAHNSPYNQETEQPHIPLSLPAREFHYNPPVQNPPQNNTPVQSNPAMLPPSPVMVPQPKYIHHSQVVYNPKPAAVAYEQMQPIIQNPPQPQYNYSVQHIHQQNNQQTLPPAQQQMVPTNHYVQTQQQQPVQIKQQHGYSSQPVIQEQNPHHQQPYAYMTPVQPLQQVQPVQQSNPELHEPVLLQPMHQMSVRYQNVLITPRPPIYQAQPAVIHNPMPTQPAIAQGSSGYIVAAEDNSKPHSYQQYHHQSTDPSLEELRTRKYEVINKLVQKRIVAPNNGLIPVRSADDGMKTNQNNTQPVYQPIDVPSSSFFSQSIPVRTVQDSRYDLWSGATCIPSLSHSLLPSNANGSGRNSPSGIDVMSDLDTRTAQVAANNRTLNTTSSSAGQRTQSISESILTNVSIVSQDDEFFSISDQRIVSKYGPIARTVRSKTTSAIPEQVTANGNGETYQFASDVNKNKSKFGRVPHDVPSVCTEVASASVRQNPRNNAAEVMLSTSYSGGSMKTQSETAPAPQEEIMAETEDLYLAMELQQIEIDIRHKLQKKVNDKPAYVM